MNRSRMRYESEIHDQQDHIDSFKNLIPQLEQQERQMLEKLKNTQTQHQHYVEDLNLINNSKRPTGPLSSVRLK